LSQEPFNIEGLLKQALRCGIGVAEFWDMTPREALMAIEAAIWRDERRQELDIIQAWSMATLMRAKRIPSLKQLLDTKPAKPLHGKELEKRRQEFANMTKNLNLEQLANRMKKATVDINKLAKVQRTVKHGQ
jgi:hypothetical protein